MIREVIKLQVHFNGFNEILPQNVDILGELTYIFQEFQDKIIYRQFRLTHQTNSSQNKHFIELLYFQEDQNMDVPGKFVDVFKILFTFQMLPFIPKGLFVIKRSQPVTCSLIY